MTAAARKKFIALLLVLVLLFSLLPAAFAADGEGVNSGGTEASSDPTGSSEGGDPDDNGTTSASSEPTGSSEGGENGGNGEGGENGSGENGGTGDGGENGRTRQSPGRPSSVYRSCFTEHSSFQLNGKNKNQTLCLLQNRVFKATNPQP